MKTSVRIAALLLGSVLFIGCDNKDATAPTSTQTVTVTPATPTPPTTPAMPDMSKAATAVDNAVDKGAAAAKTEADKIMSKMPTTAPATPAMPAMPK